MDYVGTRRFFLLAVSFLLFLYLGLNLLLNVSDLPARIQQRVTSSTGLSARVSYLYVNWRGNPVAHRVQVGPREDTDTSPRLTLNRVETVLDWRVLLADGPEAAVTALRVKRIRARVPPRLLGGITGGGRPAGIPVRVNRWELTLDLSTPGSLTLGGDSAYLSPAGEVRLHVDRIAEKAADVAVTRDDDRVDVAVHRLSIPDAFWELQGDRWKGRATFRDDGDGRRLEMTLSGLPGRLRGTGLPKTELSLDLDVGDTETAVRDFSLASSFLRVSVVGSVHHVPLRVDLQGEGRASLRQQLQRVLFRDASEYLSVERISPIRTQFRVSGSPGEPHVSGDVVMGGMVIGYRTGRKRGRLTLEDVTGDLGPGEVRLTGGRGRVDGASVSLEGGRLFLEDGAFYGNVSLDSRFEGPPKGVSLPGTLTGGLGNLQRARLPLETSFRVGPRQADARLRVRDGSVAFDGMDFDGMRGHTEFGSRGPFNPGMQGTVHDADGNRWRISGRLFGPLFVRGRQVRLDGWLDAVGSVFPALPAGTSVEGVGIRAVLSDVDRDRADYSLVMELDGGRLGWAGRPLDLGGRLRATPGEVRLHDVRLRGKPGSQLRVWGDYGYDTDPGEGQFDLKVTGRDVPVLTWWPEPPAFLEGVRSSLDLDGHLRGTPRSPRYHATFHRGRVTAHGVPLNEIRGTLEGEGGRMRARVERLVLREGSGTVALDWGPSDGLGLRSRLRAVAPGALVPSGSWVEENATGRIDADVNLSGHIGTASTWSGTVALAGRDLRLSRFPPVEGIEEIARVEALQRPIVIDPVRVQLPVREGNLSLNPLKLTGSDLTLHGKGDLGFDGTLDLRFELTLEQAMLQRFLQDVLGDLYREVGLIDRPRRLTCPFVVTGRLRDPDVQLKHDEINKNFRENLINSLVTEQIGKPLNELLEEIPFLR